MKLLKWVCPDCGYSHNTNRGFLDDMCRNCGIRVSEEKAIATLMPSMLELLRAAQPPAGGIIEDWEKAREVMLSHFEEEA